MSENEIRNTLPENAYRELKPGETYVPMVPPHVDAPELTPRSIAFGIAMNILWAAAATYIALKVGQGIETAIPISILAVGLSGLLLRLGFRRSTIIENINILAISTTSGMVAGGTVFTMPAIYILGIDQHLALGNGAVFLHIFLVPLFGAVLGVIFLVPFRRFFVKEMHGKLPFPEGTATNEILVTCQGGGAGALTLIWSFAVSSLYTLGTAGLKLWSEVFTTGKIEVAWKETAGAAAPLEAVQRSVVMPAFAGDFWTDLTDRVKAVFSMGTGAEFIGLGFIMGAHYAAIIVAGSILSYLVIVPLLAPLSLEALQSISSGIESTSAEAIFKAVSKNVGIGCIFAAGVLSILKMSPIIMTALREGLGGLFRGARTTGRPERTDRDIAYPGLVVIGLLTAVALGVYFRFFVLADMPGADLLAAGSVLLALAAAFFFITVSAWAIATISVTPISGMTVTTIIVTALALAAAGLQKGPAGQFAVLLIGGVVASSLSVAGTLVTEFKLGYWAGATPRRIQWSCMIACVLASAVVAGTVLVLAQGGGFDPSAKEGALQAPQANMIAGALRSFLGTGEVPWVPYGTGAVIALMLQLIGVSPLAFGLGMFLPMELNVPILIGALVGVAVKKGTKDEAVLRARANQGTIIASGFIAGAAIVGVLLRGLKSLAATAPLVDAIDVPAALLRGGADPVFVGRTLNVLAPAALLGLCAIIYLNSRRARPPAAP